MTEQFHFKTELGWRRRRRYPENVLLNVSRNNLGQTNVTGRSMLFTARYFF
jgi:hypothetical protein